MVNKLDTTITNIKANLNMQGKPARIPDCDRDDLALFFKEMGYLSGVEIGVEKGRYTKVLLNAGLKVYAVDPWLYYEDYKHSKGQTRLDFLYGHTQRYLADYITNGQCKIIRKTSMDAVKQFADESIDFVYIDGHHGLKFVIEDIYEWSKKVKKGGIISGHDYAYTRTPPDRAWVCHVKYALHAYTEAFGVRNWYVLGSDDAKMGEKRERFRSWFWFKV